VGDAGDMGYSRGGAKEDALSYVQLSVENWRVCNWDGGADYVGLTCCHPILACRSSRGWVA